MAMTARQQRFVAEYIKDGNATQAAIRAGFSKKAARQQGARMLSYASVCDAIATARKPVIEEAQVTLEGHLKMLATLRDSALKAGQHGPAVKAEEARGKVAGFYVERHAGPTGGPLEVVVTRRIVPKT